MGFRCADQYSILHMATGVIMYFLGISFQNMLILHTLFEILENTDTGRKFITNYLTFWPGGKSNADSLINSISDTIFVIIGWTVAQQLDRMGTKRGWYYAS